MLRSQPNQPSLSVTWATLPGKPTTFPPATHTHLWADLTDKPTAFTPSAHTHAWADITGKPTIPAGATFIGNVTVAETLLLALAAGNKRKTLPLAGVTTSDKLIYAALTPCQAGCEALNVYPAAAGQVTVAYSTPQLAIGAVINIPIAVYRLG